MRMSAYDKAEAADLLVRLERHIDNIEKKLEHPHTEEDLQVLKKYWTKLSKLRDKIMSKLHEQKREKC